MRDLLGTRTRAGRLRLLLLVASIAAIAIGVTAGDRQRVSDVMTYGNFDAPPSEGASGVMYLAPGVRDRAIEQVYRFDGPVVWHPILALGALFLIILFWRVFRSPDARAGGHRWLVQWLGFVGTRVGMLRVAGVLPVPRCALGVLPLMNCQTCEMANGACPIGAAQAFLRYGDFPTLVVGTVTAFALAAGRWFCGWLCPFGLIEDLLDRLARDRLRPPRRLEWGRFVTLALVIVAPLLMGLAGVVSWFPFCSTVCPSGMILGLGPYYLTHGVPALGEVLADPATHLIGLGVFSAHALGLILYLGLALNVTGRVFCRYLCPLGAFLGLFNPIAYVRVEGSPEACGACTACHGTCPAGLAPQRDDFLARTGCLRCGRCVTACASGNRRWVFGDDPIDAAARAPDDLTSEGPGHAHE